MVQGRHIKPVNAALLHYCALMSNEPVLGRLFLLGSFAIVWVLGLGVRVFYAEVAAPPVRGAHRHMLTSPAMPLWLMAEGGLVEWPPPGFWSSLMLYQLVGFW